MNDYPTFQKRLVDFIHRYIEEIKVIVTTPNDFFRKNRDEYGFLEPTLFAGVNILIPVLFYGLLIAPFTLGLSLIFVLPSMVYGVALLFLSTVILHGLIRLLGGNEKFEVTFRCVAYSSVAAYTWLVPLPFVNLLMFGAAFCTLLYFALCESHELTPQQASLLLIAPGFLILFSGAILTIVTLWMVFKGIALILGFMLP
jgi:hypothetical protein